MLDRVHAIDAPSPHRWARRASWAGCPSSFCVLFLNASSNRVQRPRPGGRKARGWGDKRRRLPVSAVARHGIENNEELAHAGDERGLGVLTAGNAAADRKL